VLTRLYCNEHQLGGRRKKGCCNEQLVGGRRKKVRLNRVISFHSFHHPPYTIQFSGFLLLYSSHVYIFHRVVAREYLPVGKVLQYLFQRDHSRICWLILTFPKFGTLEKFVSRKTNSLKVLQLYDSMVSSLNIVPFEFEMPHK